MAFDASEPLPTGGAIAFVLRGALSEALLAAAEARATAAGFTPTGAAYPAGYRDNDRAVVDDDDLAAALFAAVRVHLPEVLVDEQGRRARLVGLNARLRFCRYRDGQSFAIHRDGAWDNGDGGRSRLTLQVYLNDAGEFSGGDTRFFAERAATAPAFIVRPERGAAIVFDHALWHDGAPVSAGEKRVLRTDVMYRLDDEHDERAAAAGADGHRGYVWTLATTPQGHIWSGSRDRTIKRWARADGGLRCIDTITGHASSVTALAVTPTRCWSGDRAGTLRAWTHDGAPALRVTLVAGTVAHTAGAAITCLAAGVGDDVLVGAADGVVRVVSAGGAVRAAIPAHDGWVWGVAARSGALWSAGADGCLRRHDLPPTHADDRFADARGAVVLAADQPLTALAVRGAATGPLVAVGDQRGRLLVIDDGGVRSVLAHAGAIRAVAVLDDSTVVTGGEDDLACVWHINAAGLAPGLRMRHGDFVRALAVLDEQTVASAGYDGHVRTWSPRT